MDYETMRAVDAMRAAKDASGLTDKEIAERSGIPVNVVRQYLCRTDGYMPGLDKIPALCRAMGNTILLKWLEAQCDMRAEAARVAPATSRAEVLTSVARIAATLGDAQRRLADSEISGIDPACARDVRGLLSDVVEECRASMATLLPLARCAGKADAMPLMSMRPAEQPAVTAPPRKAWWRFWE